ncbi:MAG: octaprenyl-diphosphate synthase [Gammaproteobacteria bacterium]|jgi:octaprenyl-diphosphate synthase
MAKTMDAIKKPIAKELEIFEKRFREAMKSKVPLLDKITYYIVQRKGKQMRPMFVFLCARLIGPTSDASYSAASLIELVHTATLVHDDVVDDSFQRRSFFSVNSLWKNKIAVIVGDYILSQGLLIAVRNKQFRMLEIFSQAVTEMAEGELLQIEKARRLDIEEPIYYEIIRQKTASLIAAACAGGIASNTKDESLIEKGRLFGEKCGIAFQIRDDLFDFGVADVGKPLGIDIKEKKMTLPLIYALNHSSRSERRRIISIIKKDSENQAKVMEVIQFVRDSGGLDYAMKAMYDYREQAFEILDTFEESEARTALRELVIYVTEREK